MDKERLERIRAAHEARKAREEKARQEKAAAEKIARDEEQKRNDAARISREAKEKKEEEDGRKEYASEVAAVENKTRALFKEFSELESDCLEYQKLCKETNVSNVKPINVIYSDNSDKLKYGPEEGVPLVDQDVLVFDTLDGKSFAMICKDYDSDYFFILTNGSLYCGTAPEDISIFNDLTPEFWLEDTPGRYVKFMKEKGEDPIEILDEVERRFNIIKSKVENYIDKNIEIIEKEYDGEDLNESVGSKAMNRPITFEQCQRANKLGLIDHVFMAETGPSGEDGPAYAVSMNPEDADFIEDEGWYEYKDEFENGDVLVFDVKRCLSQDTSNYIADDSSCWEYDDEIFFDTDGVDEDDLRYIFREDFKEYSLYRGKMLGEDVGRERGEYNTLGLKEIESWTEDGKDYVEYSITKDRKDTGFTICIVITERQGFVDSVIYNEKNEDKTTSEVAQELDISRSNIKKLVIRAKIKAMNKFGIDIG